MEFVALTEREVRNLKFACGNFLQSWEMYRRYHDLGREAYFMGVRNRENEVVAAGLMLARPWKLGKKVFRVPGGWLMDYDGENYAEILEFLTRRAREFCAEKGGIALEIAPNIVAEPRDAHNNVIEGENHLAVKAELERLGYKYLGEYEQVKWTFVKELEEKTSEEMLMELRTDHRQRIRRAQREGVRVRELGDDELGILKEIAAEAGVRHGFRDPELEYYRSMKSAFGKKVKFMVAELPVEKLSGELAEKYGANATKKDSDEKKVVNLAEKSGKNDQRSEYVPLAAAMFVNDGNEMVYLYSGSVRDLQKYGGAHLMQWEMIQEAMRTGCKKYNFYGVRPVEGDGVYNFKLGFRGKVEELLGTFILPIGWLGELYASRLKPKEYGEVR